MSYLLQLFDSSVPVRCQLTPVDSAVPSLYLDLGRRAAQASGTRTETVSPGSSNDLREIFELDLSTGLDC